MILNKLRNQNRFLIYGAQVIAYGAYTAIKELTGLSPEAFVVTCKDNNPDAIEGIPVCSADILDQESYKSIFILVAVTELIQKDVLPFLEEKGCCNYLALTQRNEYSLMSTYFKKVYGYKVATYGNKCVSDFSGNAAENYNNYALMNNDVLAANTARPYVDFVCYEVSNHRDTPLVSHPALKSFERAIQAGKAITDISIADVHDDTGINISAKNKQYCEMTATYWVWKNTSHDWKGIEHYRRHIIVDTNMLTDDVDVIIPLPYICYPNTMTQFRRFISDDVYEALLETLKIVHTGEYSDYEKILFGKLQYTYNIVCAKREVFDAYCQWFFEITEYMETLSDKIPEIKETRALSYVAEVLTNLYFMYNHNKLNILHVMREIYV